MREVTSLRQPTVANNVVFSEHWVVEITDKASCVRNERWTDSEEDDGP